jgi:hypothetical protein
MNITVLTPSIGTPELKRCAHSVSVQTVTPRHIVVADGKKYHADVTKQAMAGWKGDGLTPRIFAIPDNTGANNWYGHRIYAHYSQLLDCDYLFLLDEDNTYQPDHIESLIPIAKEHGYAWSLRNVFTKDGQYLGVDTGESIGKNLDGLGYALVDTSCWCLRKDQIPYLSYFLQQWGADRVFTSVMIEKHGNIQQACSNKATANYYAPDNLIQHFKQICTL